MKIPIYELENDIAILNINPLLHNNTINSVN